MPGGEEEYIRNSLVCKIACVNGKHHRIHPYEVTPVAELLTALNAAPWAKRLDPFGGPARKQPLAPGPCPRWTLVGITKRSLFVWHS